MPDLTKYQAAPPIVRELWQNLMEKDDRNSPAEYPEMCLVTFEEFAGYIEAGAAQAVAEVEHLKALVYVPGVWRCAKCDFRLIQSNLNANTGTVTARDTPGDKCPNCQSPLWRVTERQERIEAMELAETGFVRAGKAEDALQALADAADELGVRYFDTDTMEPEVEAVQKATLAAREVLEPKTRRADAPAAP